MEEIAQLKEEIKLLNRIIMDKDETIEQLEEKHMLAIIALAKQIKQNSKLKDCLKRAYKCIEQNNCCKHEVALGCPHVDDDIYCTTCQKRYIAKGI